ncbi:MAG: BsuPI-related putative proteinase inhibitor [bacterium]
MRPPRSRFTRAALATLTIVSMASLSACSNRSDDITTPRADDAARAVDVFTKLADSVSRAGGDSTLSSAYTSLAQAVKQGGRISPIVITVDGIATPFLAAALQIESLPGPGCTFTQPCPSFVAVLPNRSLIAWQQDDPRRVVQLSSAADGDPIAAYLYPTFAPFPFRPASLIFIDGKGGTFFGTSGAQRFTPTFTTTPCTASTGSAPDDSSVRARCTQATFDVTFDAKAEASSFLTRNNTATGSHSFGMTSQSISGAHLELPVVTIPLPPITVQPSASLPAVLTSKVDSLVTLTLTVTNPATTPADVSFATGQRYEFTISDASGVTLWRWSDGMAFTQLFGTQTLAAGGTLVFTAQWKPTTKGSFVASGALVSVSHHAGAKATLVVP